MDQIRVSEQMLLNKGILVDEMVFMKIISTCNSPFLTFQHPTFPFSLPIPITGVEANTAAVNPAHLN